MARPMKTPDKTKPPRKFVMIGVYPGTRIRLKKLASQREMHLYELIDELAYGDN